MTESDHPIDRAIRDHLDTEAASVDARTMLVRVTAARVTAATPRTRWARWAGGLGMSAAVAAGLAIFFLLGGTDSNPVAADDSAAELVQQARTVHSTPTDRCYEVVAEWDPIPFQRLKIDPVVRKARLWTRGDQFWIETQLLSGQTIAWGQTTDGRVWVAPPNQRFGLVYDPDELGEPLTRYCELMSLRVVATLGELLERFDLYRRDSGLPGEPVQIEARLRPAPDTMLPRFGHVELELDPITKAIRKATLRRLAGGRTVSTLRFTLVETANLPADRYTVRGHIDAGGVVLDRHSVPKAYPWLVRIDPRVRLRDDILRRFQMQMK